MYEVRRLRSGLPVVLDGTLQVRTFTICVAVGRSSRDEPADRIGQSHMLEHAVMSAAQSDTGRSVSAWATGLGGQSNAATSKDFMAFWLRVPPEHAVESTRRLCQALVRPRFTDELAVHERRVVVQELRAAAADPLDRADEAFHARLFPDHPLGRPVGGSADDFPELSADILAAALAEALATGALCVSLVGSPAQLEPAYQELAGGGFAELDRTGDRPKRLPPLAGPATDLAGQPAETDADYAYLVAGGRGADRSDPLWAGFQLLTAAVGGTPGSLLYERVRSELGIAYELQSIHSAYYDCGVWRVIAGSQPSNVDTVRAVVRDSLEDIARNGLPAPELAAARAQAAGSVLIDNEDPVELAHINAYWGAEDLADPAPVVSSLARIAAAGNEQVAAAAARLLGGWTDAVCS